MTPGTLTTTPASDSVGVANSLLYVENLVTTGNTGSVTYAQASLGQSHSFSLNPTTGVISTTGTLAAGTYTISGTTSDSYGDTGPWSFNLAVTPGTLTTTPASNSVRVAGSASYVENMSTTGWWSSLQSDSLPCGRSEDDSVQVRPLLVTGNTGSVTYTQAS